MMLLRLNLNVNLEGVTGIYGKLCAHSEGVRFCYTLRDERNRPKLNV